MSCGRQVALCGVGTGWVGLGGESLLEVGAPGIEVVDPGLDGEDPGAELVDGEAGRPHIVGQGGHGAGAPVDVALCL